MYLCVYMFMCCVYMYIQFRPTATTSFLNSMQYSFQTDPSIPNLKIPSTYRFNRLKMEFALQFFYSL